MSTIMSSTILWLAGSPNQNQIYSLTYTGNTLWWLTPKGVFAKLYYFSKCFELKYLEERGRSAQEMKWHEIKHAK